MVSQDESFFKINKIKFSFCMNAEVLLKLYYCGCFVVKFDYKKVSPFSCSKSQVKQTEKAC
jgi:hypothetical protein